jgi:hypothetical protein
MIRWNLVLKSVAALFLAWLALIACTPKRSYVHKLISHNFPAYFVTVVMDEEDRVENWNEWATHSIRGKLGIMRNYFRFHSLPKEKQLQIVANYVDWLRYDHAEKQEAKEIYQKLRSKGKINHCKPKAGHLPSF